MNDVKRYLPVAEMDHKTGRWGAVLRIRREGTVVLAADYDTTEAIMRASFALHARARRLFKAANAAKRCCREQATSANLQGARLLKRVHSLEARLRDALLREDEANHELARLEELELGWHAERQDLQVRLGLANGKVAQLSADLARIRLLTDEVAG